MEEGTLIQRLYDMISKVEYGGKDDTFKHMKTCPCCGVFGPDQFGTKGEHKPNCELYLMKELMNDLLKQTDLDLHRDNMWYAHQTQHCGSNQTLVGHCLPDYSGTHTTGQLMTSKG